MSDINGVIDILLLVFGMIYSLWFVFFLKVALDRYKNKVAATFFVWAPFVIVGMYLYATHQFGIVIFPVIPEPINTILLFASWPVFYLGNLILRVAKA